MLKLLIVDDEAYVRDGIEKNLAFSELGIGAVWKAATGREGLAIAEERRPDIIISDVRMPQMNGLDMAKTLVERFPQTKFIFISAYSEIEYYRSAIKLHAVGFIEKPIILEELFAEVRRAADLIRSESRQAEPALTAAEQEEIALLSLLHGAGTIPSEIRQKLVQSSKTRFTLFAVGRIPLFSPQDAAFIRGEFRRVLYPDVPCTLCGAIGRNFAILVASAPLTALQADALSQILLDRLSAQHPFITCAQASAVEDVARAYESAAAQQELQFYFPDAHFHAASNDGILQSQPLTFGSDFFAAFSDCVSQHDAGRAMALVRDELNRLVRPRLCAPEHARMAVLHLLNTASGLFVRCGVASARNPAGWPEVSRAKTFEALAQFAMDSLRAMFAALDSISESGRIIYLIKREIEANYADATFSIAALAKRLHFSESYVGSLFKRHTDMTIGGYLNQVRMERAKQLLLDPARKVGEVGALVGIDNTDYFTRRFKQYTGKTPSEYRR